MVWSPGPSGFKGQRNENDFLCLTDFKLLNQMKGNAMNYCDIFKLIIFV